VAPQLVGILSHWSDVVTPGALLIPGHLLPELEAVWALLPPATPEDLLRDSIRKTIGNRGELYSYQMERQRADVASNIVWVARDDDTLGYDIEDRSSNPRRKIEVKASGNTAVRFLLSENEWRKAHEGPTEYEIHFWGGIDLALNPADEFLRLRARGFPLIFGDLPRLLHTRALDATPTKWRISGAKPS
jgi:hypothetical protein